MPDRAVLFIDGNNWYHSLRDCGVPDLFTLDYAGISRKLCTPREWLATRYYIGSLPHNHPTQPDQRRFIARLEQQDSRISVHLGRLENRRQPNILADQLRDFLRDSGPSLPASAFQELSRLLATYGNLYGLKEKAADVKLAVDLCRMAWENAYDAAYLLSADGDFTPAVEMARDFGKSVYVASPAQCGALAKVAKAYIRLPLAWFDGMHR